MYNKSPYLVTLFGGQCAMETGTGMHTGRSADATTLLKLILWNHFGRNLRMNLNLILKIKFAIVLKLKNQDKTHIYLICCFLV
jgi:hypothetical protein